MTDDSWKGEHLIRGRKPESNRPEATRLVNVLAHAQRRKLGLPAAGRKSIDVLWKSIRKNLHDKS